MTPAQKQTAELARLVEQDLAGLAQILHALGAKYTETLQVQLMAKATAAERIIEGNRAAGQPPDPTAQRDYLTHRLAYLGIGQIYLVLAEARRLESESN